MSPLSPEQLTTSIARLRRLRHELVQTATPAADGSLVPMLNASAACCALDNAIRLLERELRSVAS